MLWVVLASFTGLAVFAVLWPLSRSPAASDARALDVAFYRAQTDEIARDAARGLIDAAEVEGARTEAARRLVAASRHEAAGLRAGTRRAPLAVALGALVAVPAVALGLYAVIGAPGLPDLPLEARLHGDPATMDMATIIARIERNVADKPDDGRGWSLLARLYARMGRTDEAIAAYRNEIRVLGPGEERLSGLAEALTSANNGVITPEARDDIAAALKLDPASPRARFYGGLAAEQAGDKTTAVASWKRLAADAPAGAPWLPAVQARIAAAAGEPAVPAGAPSAAPSARAAEEGENRAKTAAAITAMPPNEREAMIHRMVDGLAERLKAKGDDVDGWLRLVRAYRVLGEDDKARVALTDAHRTLAADPAAAGRLDALARELGLEG